MPRLSVARASIFSELCAIANVRVQQSAVIVTSFSSTTGICGPMAPIGILLKTVFEVCINQYELRYRHLIRGSVNSRSLSLVFGRVCSCT